MHLTRVWMGGCERLVGVDLKEKVSWGGVVIVV